MVDHDASLAVIKLELMDGINIIPYQYVTLQGLGSKDPY